MTIYSGFSHEKWWFSIAMLVYQRLRHLPFVFCLKSEIPMFSFWNHPRCRMWYRCVAGLKPRSASGSPSTRTAPCSTPGKKVSVRWMPLEDTCPEVPKTNGESSRQKTQGESSRVPQLLAPSCALKKLMKIGTSSLWMLKPSWQAWKTPWKDESLEPWKLGRSEPCKSAIPVTKLPGKGTRQAGLLPTPQIKDQSLFQEPKLELPSMYMAYVRAKFQEIWYTPQMYSTSILGSWKPPLKGVE